MMDGITIYEVAQVLSWIITVGIGVVAFKFYKEAKDHKINLGNLSIEDQKLINAVQEQVRASLLEELNSYRDELREQVTKNTKLEAELNGEKTKSALLELQVKHQQQQIDILRSELSKLRRRMAAHAGKRPCDKCENPEECVYGLECVYEI